MIQSEKALQGIDNGGNRSGNDRRKFHYTAYIPERRSGRDRRRGFDRRSTTARRRGTERRAGLNGLKQVRIERRDIFRLPA